MHFFRLTLSDTMRSFKTILMTLLAAQLLAVIAVVIGRWVAVQDSTQPQRAPSADSLKVIRSEFHTFHGISSFQNFP